MSLPNISQYADSIANPFGLTRTLGEFEAQRDVYGKVMIRSGNSAAVFRVNHAGHRLMLKCYIKQGLHRAAIYGFLAELNDLLLVPTRLLPGELYVYDTFDNGHHHDIVVAEWAEGDTLDAAIRLAVADDDPTQLMALSEAFDRMALELLGREWAHGDLKPENIIVCPDGSMKLIDYDAMFFHALAGQITSEVGTPAYQHPSRDETVFNKHIDDYPIALISASLRALALEPSLYAKYNHYDNIILYPDEILAGACEAYKEAMKLLARGGMHIHYHLARILNSTTAELPGLHAIIKSIGTGNAFAQKTGRLQLFVKNGLWGYSDDNGITQIEAVYDEAVEFSEDTAVVKLHGITQVIDTSGVVVINDENFEIIKPFCCGLAAVSIGGKWGFIDHGGNIAIEPVYAKVGSMRSNIAAVLCHGTEGALKWGYIDNKGVMVISPQYDHARGFKDGQAMVEKDGQTVMIAR